MRTLFILRWSDWQGGLITTITIIIVVGQIAAALSPRGPATTSQTLWSLVLAIAIGMAVGLVKGNRRNILAHNFSNTSATPSSYLITSL
jgi:hypothetical protein